MGSTAARTAHRRTIAAVVLAAVCFLASWPGPVRAQEIQSEAYVTGVVGHPQSYPLSCESRSAADWAAYFGFAVSENEILAALPRTDNPETGFVGSPSGSWGSIPPWSYGVHPPPLAAVLRDFGVPAVERQGLGWDSLRQEIAAGRPVVVWIIGQMWNGTPISYTASDGQTTTVAYYEHVMMAVGYAPGLVYVIDAYTGFEQIYDLNSFLASWAVLGERAIIAGPDMPVRSTPMPAATGTYAVQRGDTLIALAEQFNLPWRDLAALNRIPYPYLLMAGQTLRLPESAAAEPEAPAETVEPVPTLLPPPAETPVVPGGEPVPGVYVVQVRDTLLNIAGDLSVPWQELALTNELAYPYFIHPGQELRLPAQTALLDPLPAETQQSLDQAAETDPDPAPTGTSPETYVVQRGDYLTGVAQAYGLDWLDLAQLNGLQNPYNLFPGQVLRLR